jgi:hypothetical protein
MNRRQQECSAQQGQHGGAALAEEFLARALLANALPEKAQRVMELVNKVLRGEELHRLDYGRGLTLSVSEKHNPP